MAVHGAIEPLRRPTHGSQAVIDTDPIAMLASRLTGLDPGSPNSYAAPAFDQVATTGRWFTPGEVIEAMLASSGPHLSYGPAVVGARLIGSLGYAAAGRLGIAIAVAGQAYDTGPESLTVCLDDEGLVQRIAVRSRRFAVLPADPLAGTPGVTVAEDRPALAAWAAHGAYATLAPLIEQIHARTRYGTVAMWNQVADSVLGPATKSPLLAGGDQSAGRAAGQLFLDALVAEGAPIRRRGTVRRAPDGRSRPVLDPVRGMCCLLYRQDEAKCASCPLVDKDRTGSCETSPGKREPGAS